MKRLLLVICLVIVPIFVSQLIVSKEARADWLDTAWSQRSTVIVTNPGGSQLGFFQVHLSLDSTFDFSSAKTDGSDVRFTSDNGSTLIPFWIESWNASSKTASIWVNVPTIPATGTTIYLYYGNPSATSVSDGDVTFEAFDDFESGRTAPGYYQLGSAQTVLTKNQSWEGSSPHTLSMLQNTGGGATYTGYYGLQGWHGSPSVCSVGIGLVSSNDLVNWTKNANNPIISNGRWPSVLKVGGTYYMLYEKDFCTLSNIVLATSTDGINFKDVKTIVPPQTGFANQNPNLFLNPNDGMFYIYWYHGDDSTFWQIRARSASTPEGLDNTASETIVLQSNKTLAAPNMLYRDGTYFLSTEVLDSNGLWATQVYASTYLPTLGFNLLLGSPLLSSGSACNFQHVVGTELHDYYCKYDGNTWTVEQRIADLTTGRAQFPIPLPDPRKWSVTGGTWTGITTTQEDGTIGGILQGSIYNDRDILKGIDNGTDYILEAYGKQIGGRLWGLGVRATDQNNLYTANLFEDLDATNNLSLYNLVGGSPNVLGSASVGTVDLNKWYKLSVKVHGNSIDVYKDNVLKLQSTSKQYANGAVALYGEKNTVAEFNNVIVRKYATTEPIATLISSGNPVPVITTLAPSSVTAGGGAFSLTVNGSGFSTNSVVLWNGSNRLTTYVSQVQLKAAISAGDIAAAGTVQVTVFNPAPAGGTSNTQTLTISTESLKQSITQWKGNKQGAISLTFDDGYRSQYTVGVSALNDFGFKGTFFVITDDTSLSAPDNNMASWDNWVAAANMGHEIGSHTKTHPYLTTLSASSLQDEILGSQLAVDNQITSQKCLTFAYPFGDLNANVQGVVKSAYISARGIRWGINSSPIDMFNLYAVFPDVADSLGVTLESQVDLAEKSGQWIVAGFHGLDGTDYAPVTEARFRQFLQYLGSKNLWLGTLGSVVKYIKERDAANLSIISSSSNGLILSLTDGLDDVTYNEPLTIRSEVPSSCNSALVVQGNNSSMALSAVEGTSKAIYYNAVPDRGLITITCNTINQSLVAVNDTYSTSSNTPINLTAPGVLSNDTSSVGSILTAQLLSGPSHGTLSLNANGSFTYTPVASYAGNDTFNYVAYDGTNTSNAATVTITVNSPIPVNTGLVPASANAGDVAFTLTVNGTGFVGGSNVRWNGSNRTTTYVSATQLTATITAADIATSGTAQITVFNPTPGGGTSNAQTFTINAITNPVPTTTSLSPASRAVGGAAFTLTVNGTGFVSGSLVRWNGSNRTTTYVSTTQLTAAITAADIATSGTAPITVFNPAPGGGTSNAQTFTVSTTTNPVPTTSSLSPTSRTVGGAAFTLTVNGTGFVSGSSVRWNGSSRTTTYVSSTRLTAAITAADLATAGTAQVTVFNPTPGGGTSNAQAIPINNPVPTTTSLSPTSRTAGGAAFTLTVNGTGFVSGSSVRWNGSSRTTTYVSSTRLTAAITAADIATTGTAQVTVFNPTPGGGTSSTRNFSIR